MADLISYRLTNADDSRLVSLVINGVEKRLLFSESDGENNQADWAAYQAWLKLGNEPAAPPVARIPPPATIEQKLQSIGLSVETLKEALGLNA